jgi:hypothetical protein
MRNRSKLTDEQKDEIRLLIKEGDLSTRQIADKYDVPTDSIKSIKRYMKKKSTAQTKICEYPGCNKPVAGPRSRTCGHEHMVALRHLHSKEYTHVCAYCGKTFADHHSTTKYCNGPHYATCKAVINGKVCGKKFKVGKYGGGVACCTSHAAIIGHTEESDAKRSYSLEHSDKFKTAMRERAEYLNEHPEEDTRIGSKRFKENLNEKYGVDNVSSLDSVKKKKIATLREHYGVDNPMQDKAIQEAVKKTNMEKYGVPAAVNLPEVQAKARAAFKKRWGSEFPMSSKKFRDEVLLPSVKKKWGTPYYLQSEAGKQHMKEFCEQEDPNAHWTSQLSRTKESYIKTCMDKYGPIDVNGELEPIVNGFQSEEVKDKIKKTLMDRYGVEYSHQIPEVAKKASISLAKTIAGKIANGEPLGTYHRISKLNVRFADMVKSIISDVIIDYEYNIPGTPYSIDFKMTSPDGKRSVLVDLNPTISHNAYATFYEIVSGSKTTDEWTGLPSSYACKRAKAAQERCPDMNLIQLWSWDLGNDEIARSINMIVERLSIFDADKKVSAHDCTIAGIDRNEANEFLSNWHVQGAVKMQSNCYALIHDGETVAVSTYGPSRFNSAYDYEWMRYAVKSGWMIRGGQSKLMKAFINDVSPSSIGTYLDLNHTTRISELYKSLGFKWEHDTGPKLRWSQYDKSVTDALVARIGADAVLGTAYGPRDECGMGNREIMFAEGWLPVFTAGNALYVWRR